MARPTSVLVVANATADSDVLLGALRQRAGTGETRVTLVVPAGGTDRVAAREQLDRALLRMREAGLAAEGALGPPDPAVAAKEVWSPSAFDEVVVCTLPVGASRWLQIDLPHRLERLLDAPVTHVEVPEPRRAEHHAYGRPPEREKLGLLEPLGSLGWAGKRSPGV
jgi:hypothetical protein